MKKKFFALERKHRILFLIIGWLFSTILLYFANTFVESDGSPNTFLSLLWFAETIIAIIITVYFSKSIKNDKKNTDLFAPNSQSCDTSNFNPKQNEEDDFDGCKESIGMFQLEDTNLVFVDVETASLANNTVCSIGCIIISNGRLREYHSFINPGHPITNTQFHGVNDSMVQDSPKLNDYWKNIENYLNGDFIIIGHNIKFDIAVLKSDLSRYSINFDVKNIVDTMNIAKYELYNGFTEKGDLKLNCICEKMNIELNHHNAASDITATKKIFDTFMNESNINDYIEPYYGRLSDSRIDSELYSGLVKKVSYAKYWSDIEKGCDIKYFTNFKKTLHSQDAVYDIPTLEDLRYTSLMDRSNVNIERIRDNYKTIVDEISKFGKVYSKGAKSAKSYIEFYFMEYEEYLKLKEKGYKIFHADDVITFIIKNAQQIEKAIAEKKEEEDKRFLLEEEKAAEKKKKADIKRRQEEEKEARRINALKHKKIYYQLDDNGNTLDKFESLSQAVDKTGINDKSIRDCCKGIQKHAGGYVWRIEEIDLTNDE